MAIWFDYTTATYWQDWDRTDKYADISISTSEVNKKDDGTKSYSNSNWRGRLVGHAYQKYVSGNYNLNKADKFTIIKGKVTNEFYKKDGEKKNYLVVVITDFEKGYVKNPNLPDSENAPPKKKVAPPKPEKEKVITKSKKEEILEDFEEVEDAEEVLPF